MKLYIIISISIQEVFYLGIYMLLVYVIRFMLSTALSFPGDMNHYILALKITGFSQELLPP